MTIGIIGLGLIGGSLAKALKDRSPHRILGRDRQNVTDFALSCGAIDGLLSEENIPGCDVIIAALYPDDTISEITKLAPYLSKDTVVTDCAGIKEKVCDALFPLARAYGFTFIGGHPMAGTQYSGYKHSRADMYDGAPMVIVPPKFDDIELLDRIKTLLRPARFGRISAITADDHDKRIAFTSQLAHVVSNAYVKSPTARRHDGFSAGSYRDLTRVAWLNPDMWAELFIENQEPLLFEIDTIIASLNKYRDALAEGNFEDLRALLDEGRRIKEEVDG